jgi:hypothetical protein
MAEQLRSQLLGPSTHRRSVRDCPVCLAPLRASESVVCPVCRTCHCITCFFDVLESRCVKCRRTRDPKIATEHDLEFDPSATCTCASCGWVGVALLLSEHKSNCFGPSPPRRQTSAPEPSPAAFPLGKEEEDAQRRPSTSALVASPTEVLETGTTYRVAEGVQHSRPNPRAVPRAHAVHEFGADAATMAAMQADIARRALERPGGVTDCDAWFRMGTALQYFERGIKVSVAGMSVTEAQCFANALTLALGPKDGTRGDRAFAERREWVCGALTALSQRLGKSELVAIRGRLLSAEDCLVGALAACDGERSELWFDLAMMLPRSNTNVLRLRERAAGVATILSQPQSVVDFESRAAAEALAAHLTAAVLPPSVTRRDCLVRVLQMKPLYAGAYAELAECLSADFDDRVRVNGFMVNKQEAALLALGMDRRMAHAWRALADTLEVGDVITVPSLPADQEEPMIALRHFRDGTYPLDHTASVVSYEDCLALAETFS